MLDFSAKIRKVLKDIHNKPGNRALKSNLNLTVKRLKIVCRVIRYHSFINVFSVGKVKSS